MWASRMQTGSEKNEGRLIWEMDMRQAECEHETMCAVGGVSGTSKHGDWRWKVESVVLTQNRVSLIQSDSRDCHLSPYLIGQRIYRTNHTTFELLSVLHTSGNTLVHHPRNNTVLFHTSTRSR